MLVKSKSFLVKKANGTDDFRIQLREAYVKTIRSEKKLREVLLRTINGYSSKSYSDAMMKHYNAGDLLFVMREIGMIGGSERIVTKQGAKS